ncbi:hypothetical protein ACFQE8_25330 [Salinirubellus sp. GCM10025818]|uniref:hypothetical protein n=1 Tax=Salinirubellus TaxID=2162630 RepID=UPI0030D1B2B6
MRRRSLLRVAVALPLAGCAGSPSPTPTSSPATGSGDDGTSPTLTDVPRTAGEPGEAGTPADPAESPESRTTEAGSTALDLREANVTGVSVSGSGESLEFAVTLHHDDAGEEGYADWWQVERLDGTRLGRRDLLHAHGTREFTRSAAVEIPATVTCVVVRGHDRTHGYGGRAALVDLDSGTTRFVDQGPDPRSFSANDCP